MSAGREAKKQSMPSIGVAGHRVALDGGISKRQRKAAKQRAIKQQHGAAGMETGMHGAAQHPAASFVVHVHVRRQGQRAARVVGV